MDAFRSNSSKQIADQYKPAPGYPYRPVLSPPQQIYNLQPGWSNCVITHAFAGIDPPKLLTPAAALVPDPTSTSAQIHTPKTTSEPSLKPVSGAAEAGSTKPTKRPVPSPAPAHKHQSTGPRSTPGPSSPSSPSSPSNAKKQPETPETSSDSIDTSADKIHSRPEGSQVSVPLEATSGTQSSSKTAKDSSIQDPFEDGTLQPVADAQISKSFYPFHPSKTFSDPSSEVRPLSPSTVRASVEIYEDGASTSLSSTAQSPHSDENYNQNYVSSGLNRISVHSGLLQESEDPQGTATAEPGSWRLQPQTKSEVSATNHNLDPLADPSSVPDPVRQPGDRSPIGSSTPAARQNSLYSSLPNTGGQQQPQMSSFGLNFDSDPASTTAAESESSLDGKPDHLASATLPGFNLIPQTGSNQLTSTISTAFNQSSDSEPDPSFDPAASTSIFPTSLMSDSNAREASALTTLKESPNVTPDPPPESVHGNANTLNGPQSVSSGSISAVLGNQTAIFSQPNSMSTASRLSPASSSTNSVVLYTGGGKENTSFGLEGLSIWLASVFLLFFPIMRNAP